MKAKLVLITLPIIAITLSGCIRSEATLKQEDAKVEATYKVFIKLVDLRSIFQSEYPEGRTLTLIGSEGVSATFQVKPGQAANFELGKTYILHIEGGSSILPGLGQYLVSYETCLDKDCTWRYTNEH